MTNKPTRGSASKAKGGVPELRSLTTLLEELRATTSSNKALASLEGIKSWAALARILATNTLPEEIAIVGILALRDSGFRGKARLLARIALELDRTRLERLAALSAFNRTSRRFEKLVIDHLSRNPEDELLVSLIFALRWFGSKRCCEILCRFCEYPDAETRGAAIEVAGTLGCKIAPALVTKLLNDESPNVRSLCIQAIVLLHLKGYKSELERLTTDPRTDLFGETVGARASYALARVITA